MRFIIIIAVASAIVIEFSFFVNAHGDHFLKEPKGYVSYVSQTLDGSNAKTEITKRKDKDAFYGNATAQADRDAMELLHQARLALKSGKGFMADLKLAVQDLTHRTVFK